MIIIHDDSFTESLEKIKDVSILKRAAKTIEKFVHANTLKEVTNVKPMAGYFDYYRISFSDYRIGFRLVGENTIILLVIEHRSKIYRTFPKNYA